MSHINQIISELRNEADIDFIDFSFVVGMVEEDLKPRTQQEIRGYALEVVKGLMACSVFPGNYSLDTLQQNGFQFWPGTPEEILKRIESEWIALGKTPTLLEPICWFALRSSRSK